MNIEVENGVYYQGEMRPVRSTNPICQFWQKKKLETHVKYGVDWVDLTVL